MTVIYRNLAGHELDAGLFETWDNLHGSRPEYGSPFLSPAFTRAAAAVRKDIFVTLIENDGEVVGFFPFQRHGPRGKPVAGQLNDCQALIADPEAVFSVIDLLKASGMNLWDFDHLLTHEARFSRFAERIEESPVINLEQGIEAFLKDRAAAGSRRLQQFARKRRKLIREHGGEDIVRFEANSASREALDRVIAWKIAQCERTGTPAYFREPWAVDLVRHLMAEEAPGCAGALSVLWVGDEVVAAHFGIRSRAVWHWWFPTYAHEWSAYSPGAVLLLSLCDHVGGPEAIQTVIDLGKGDDAYKSSFANGSYALWEGHVAHHSLYASARGIKRGLHGWARSTPLLAGVRRVRRSIRGR